MIENILFRTHKIEEGGEIDPLIPPDEDDAAANDENTTQPFQSGDHSTPGPSDEEVPMTTFAGKLRHGSPMIQSKTDGGWSISEHLSSKRMRLCQIHTCVVSIN